MGTLESLQEDFSDAFSKLYEAGEALHNANLRQLRAKNTIDIQKGIALADGSIEGKNETIREANARKTFPAAYKELEESEEHLLVCKREFAVWANRVDELKIYLRIQEAIIAASP